MKLEKIGETVVVRVSDDELERLGIPVGSMAEVRSFGCDESQTYGELLKLPKDELFRRVRALARPLPADFKFDREAANSRGSDDGE